jgi:Membrane-associated sensor, integral membrane domain
MAQREASDEPVIGLATASPTVRQYQLALAVLAILLAVFGLTIPFAGTTLPELDAFIPTLEAIIFLCDLITAVLLFGQFSMLRWRALLVLASGYLFSGLIVLPHVLTFPGAFSPTGLLGAGLQSAAFLYTTHFAYSTYAKATTARRDNLMRTVDRLTGALNDAKAALAEALLGAEEADSTAAPRAEHREPNAPMLSATG